MVKYEFLNSNHVSWKDVLNDSRSTVSKEALDKEPSTKFKRAILIAMHSTIRNLTIRWKWLDIPSFCATHFSRHKFEKFISTQRSDRTGVNRNNLPQDAPVSFTGVANAQNIIDMMSKRLCLTADKTTVEYARSLKKELRNIEPELADVCVPSCIMYGGCREEGLGTSCHFYENFLKRHPEITVNTSIQERYDIYNQDFYKN